MAKGSDIEVSNATVMHLSLLQDPNGQPRAEGTRLATEGEGASRD